MRLLLKVTDAVSKVWDSQRVGVRLSPSSTWMDCPDSVPRHLYSEVVSALAPRDLAYVQVFRFYPDGTVLDVLVEPAPGPEPGNGSRSG